MSTSLYREEILDHYKNPRNFGALPDATVRLAGDNMPCGDHIEIAVRTSGGIIEKIKFEGSGCALSIAATSMLTELVKNKTISEINSISDEGLMQEIMNGKVSPSRSSCVLLGLNTLKKALVNHKNASQSAPRITKDMNLGEIAARWPHARSVLLDYGLHCVGCFASSFDTIEAGGKVHGMSEEDIEEMVGEMNKAINNSE